MKYHTSCLCLLGVILIAVLTTPATSAPILEWHVQVGDSMSYWYSIYFDSRDPDGDGSPYSHTWESKDENNELASGITQEGTKFTVKIIALNGVATIQQIYGDIHFPTENSSISSFFIEKTLDNHTYWAEYVENHPQPKNAQLNMSLKGDEIVTQLRTQHLEITSRDIYKRDWKTGWLTYHYAIWFNDTHVISEKEFSTTRPASQIKSFDLAFLLLSFTILTLVVTRKRPRD